MKKLIALFIICLLSFPLSSCDLVKSFTIASEKETNATVATAKTTIKAVETAKATTAATTQTTTAAPKETLTVEEMEKICESYDYKTIARSPDEYKDKFVKISGKIVQTMEEETMTFIRLAEDSDYDKMWFIVYDRPAEDPRVLEDDIVTVYTQCFGLYSYDSTSGATISVPGAFALQIVIEE